MAQQSALRTAQALHDALAGVDVFAAEAVLDDASLLHLPGESGLAGQYQGGEVILGLLARMAKLTDHTLHFSPLRVIAADGGVIVLCGRANATRRGKRLDTDVVYVLSLRQGMVQEIWLFHQDQDHVDEFWAA
jgi:ketosteroid isomerase-like protein